MKTHLTVHIAVFAAMFAMFGSTAKAGGQEPRSRAEALLARDGRIVVQNAGPYVETGSYLIQVAVKLGPPAAKLPDGSWLYHDFHVDGSEVAGTLVVAFDHGRVSHLSLVTKTVETALRMPKKAPGGLLAAKDGERESRQR